MDISNAEVPLRDVPSEDLPHCPKCKTHLLRPGVVWFGEALPNGMLDRVDEWMRHGVDLLLVIGTSAAVYPAAGYIQKARYHGARVAVINTESPSEGASQLQKGDWFFQGDAGLLCLRFSSQLLVRSRNSRRSYDFGDVNFIHLCAHV